MKHYLRPRPEPRIWSVRGFFMTMLEVAQAASRTPRWRYLARAQTYLRFPSRGCRGRLANGPRARRLANTEHGAAVRGSVAGPPCCCRREDRSDARRGRSEGCERFSTSAKLRLSSDRLSDVRSRTRKQTVEILGAEGWPSPVEGVRLEIG
jgi:hypothetical protein